MPGGVGGVRSMRIAPYPDLNPVREIRSIQQVAGVYDCDNKGLNPVREIRSIQQRGGKGIVACRMS